VKIFLASDHAGYELKNKLAAFLSSNYDVHDLGPYEYDSLDDYPDLIIPAALEVSKDNKSRGIIIGGSGQGEAIVANRIKGVRAAMYYGGNIDIVELSRTHNNANILSLGARFISFDEACDCIKIWLSSDFEGGRHQNRIEKIDSLT
tara:strand:- start:11 stop:451 length:441 start_codon:yes stop_codon:yes gene_type:complete